MTDVDRWLAVTRDDGETVGYLDPVTADYGEVVPRSRLGHAVGDVQDFHAAEELVLGRGLRELTETWLLDGVGAPLAIIELSPHGIALRDALSSKALIPSPTVTVDWPDTSRRLRRA